MLILVTKETRSGMVKENTKMKSNFDSEKLTSI